MHLVETLFPDLEPSYRGRVYFGLGANGQVKIGLTTRKNGRRGGEMHFTELCAVPGDRGTERRYHTIYAACRIEKTEWFRLTDRLLVDLIVMCVQQGEAASVQVLKDVLFKRMRREAA